MDIRLFVMYSVALLLTTVGCSETAGGGSGPISCVAGATLECACGDGTFGLRTCATTGAGWSSCDCGGDVGASDVVASDGATVLDGGDGMCTPQCQGKECGDDGCGGDCGTCTGDLACSEGLCKDVGCQGVPSSITGTFENDVSPLSFDEVTATVVHKRDIDEWEDGCISQVELIFSTGPACSLKVVASDYLHLDGAMAITEVSFFADSTCAGFPDDKEGLYAGIDGLTKGKLVMGISEVPGYDVEEACFNTTLVVELEGTITDATTGTILQILPTTLEVTGDFVSMGDYQASCPCAPSCQDKDCGDSGCPQVSCGGCGCGEACSASLCVFTACDGLECGSDGCGGSCGTCDTGFECQGGACLCVPDCGGKECGADGCGGTCGDCTDCGETCSDGMCVFSACDGKVCGPDGCGGSCGTCPSGEDCVEGYCDCVPSCVGQECGPNGCGGSCGDCTTCGETCDGAACVFTACDDKECGSDGCGGTCGTCTDPNDQCQSNQCVCVPSCSGKECGDDGCGGSCGTCPGNLSCVGGTCACNDGNTTDWDGCNDGVVAEFVVGFASAYTQRDAKVASFDDDGFVIVWESPSSSDSESIVWAQLFDADGQEVGGTLQVASGATDTEVRDGSVAALDGGGFVAAWIESYDDPSSYDTYYYVKAKRYGADGIALGGEIDVDDGPADTFKLWTETVGLPGGGFVVIYNNGGNWDGLVTGQQFDGSSAKVGAPFQVTNSIYDPFHAVGFPDGGFGIAWKSPSGDGAWGVKYDSSCAIDVAPKLLQSSSAEDGYMPQMAALSNGGFAAIWHYYEGSMDELELNAYGRVFSSSGSPVASEFLVAGGAGDQRAPAALGLPGGDFIFFWQNSDSDWDFAYDIMAQRYTNTGSKVGSTFMVSSDDMDETTLDTASFSTGGYIVVWDASVLGISGTRILAQRFSSQDGKLYH